LVRKGSEMFGQRAAVRIAATAVVMLTMAGCQLARQNYNAVAIGATEDQVKKALGAPRYQLDAEWVYTADDPRDLTKVVVRFGGDKTVVGKAWQNPEKPWENSREGEAP
jgi:hypothetical protein